jgi:uncharacterized protein YbbC (DUF1343 family)
MTHDNNRMSTPWKWMLAAWILVAPSGIGAADFAPLAAEVEAAIGRGEIPGAVVAVMHKGEVVYKQAFGQRSVDPTVEPMTLDTIFDLASISKPVACATSIMILIEEGKLRLDDKVVKFWPEFGAEGKDNITIEQLLTHTSGLIADNALSDYADGPAKSIERIAALKLVAKPGEKFIYSDVGFIVLGELVRRITGQPLNEFARARVFEPLGTADMMFQPDAARKARCAPTEPRDGVMIRGDVHDPRCWALGGVAGHAGLFGTVDDLLIYARMMLGRGNYNGKKILQPETVALMTKARAVPPNGQRGLGWDVKTSYSSNRGDMLGGFGHTGFTGTSMWIDPDKDFVVVFLSSRLHPKPKGSINALRGKVATLAAKAVGLGQAAPAPVGRETMTGIDVLARDGFAAVQGKKVGLVTNHTGRDRLGRATIDLLHKADGVQLVALFGPEHGIRGAFDENVKDAKDEKTGLPVYSLYDQQRRKPTPEMLRGIDTMVYDIQDIGCRFYTYISTLGLVMEACAENKIKLIVLDRPNPINGITVEGPLPEPFQSNFVCFHNIPLRHGMTVGELAQMFKAERAMDVDLTVIKCAGWKRSDFYDRTGLPWINPSPNMRNLSQALLYPGVGILETTNISVGRGTDTPFEWVGAPWIDSRKLAAALDQYELPGVRFVPTPRTPNSSVHAGKLCGGVQIIITEWDRVEPVRIGMTMIEALRLHFPEWNTKNLDRLLVHRPTYDAVVAGRQVTHLPAEWSIQAGAFHRRRQPFLLYD